MGHLKSTLIRRLDAVIEGARAKLFCAKEGQTARVEVIAVTVPTMTEVARSEKRLA